MLSYNAINGVPSCANDALLNGVLRKQLGFTGFVVSDYGAIPGIVTGHKFNATDMHAVAQAINSGCVCSSF